MVKDSMEIMEQGMCAGTTAVPIHYYDVDRMQERTIESCQGDLTVICNVLADYADMLDELLQADREKLGFCGAMQYERMRDRCRKITAELQEKIGYPLINFIQKVFSLGFAVVAIRHKRGVFLPGFPFGR